MPPLKQHEAFDFPVSIFPRQYNITAEESLRG